MQSTSIPASISGRMLAGLLVTLMVGLTGGGELMAQTVYKSVDDAGHVAFTDRPPLQVEGDQRPLDIMDVQIQLTDRAVVAASREADAETRHANDAAGEIRQRQATEDADKLAREDAQRADKCDQAKSRLTRYSQARRLYRETADGEREYLADGEIDKERAGAVRAVDEWCGK